MEDENIKLELFVHSVGGHSFIIKSSEGKIYKSAEKEEINFYKFTENLNFNIYHFMPKYYGIVSKTDKLFPLIENFLHYCTKFFQIFVQELNLDLHVDKKIEEFDKKYENFRENKITDFSKENMPSCFDDLKIYLTSIGEEKLRWIIFWFIKWKNLFLDNGKFYFFKNFRFYYY